MTIRFPDEFVWGAATASYQIEGHTPSDGRGKCVWDMMCEQPGKIVHGDTGYTAASHIAHMREDVALMKQIGLKAYRFSISWPRVLPNGTGEINPEGTAFYIELVDELLAAGITPFITLFHWDFPHALFLKGGWLSPDSPKWFADYVTLVADLLGNRVANWITFNEPEVFLQIGHVDGGHAPGMKYSWADALTCTHNMLLAHGMAVKVLREHCTVKTNIGMTFASPTPFPADIEARDIEATRRAIFDVVRKDLWNGSWLADAIFFGAYPEDGVKLFGSDMPTIGPDDMDIISQPIDFYGLNVYRGWAVSADGDVPHPPGRAMSVNHWDVTPECMYWATQFTSKRYNAPIYITENGLCNTDWVHLDGAVHDPQRIDYTARYLTALNDSIKDGADVRGYFHWSLMDNFEWAEGLRYRFGLIHIDYETQRRTLKDSAYWYSKVIWNNGF
jgi:beta-glucosidase